MIEKALISGQTAQALFKEEDRLFVLHAGETEQTPDCTPYEESLFFNSDSEIKVFENVSIEKLRKELLKETLCFDALHDVIAGFDGNLSRKARVLSMRHAETLVNDPEVFSFVKSRLFGNPVPREADLEKAMEYSAKNSLPYINSVYYTMSEGRETIDYILAAFKELIFKYSLEMEYIKIKNIFITSGLFSRLVLTDWANRSIGAENRVNDLCVDEKERENIVNIYKGLVDKLDKEYVSAEIEDSSSSLPRPLKVDIGSIPGKKLIVNQMNPILPKLYSIRGVGMVKMSEPDSYGTAPTTKSSRKIKKKTD